MEQHDHLELGRHQKLPMPVGILFLLMLNLLMLASNAQAQTQFVTVKILIEEAAWAGCGDGLFGGAPDIYFNVRINNALFSTRSRTITSSFSPFRVNREFSQAIDLSLGTIPVRIEQWDADGGTLGNDDKCDIKRGEGRELNLVLNLAPCQISGDRSGSCGVTIQSSVFLEQAVKFKVTVEEPPRAPGLAIRCLHNPIWPQPGDTVTIRAEALDGNGNFIFGSVDNIEIWADNTTAPIATSATTPGSAGSSTLQVNHTPAGGANDFLYRCRAVDTNNVGDIERVSSDWRRVQIGQPARGRAVGILNTGVSNNRVDIVFIADPDYAGGANDPQFLTEVSNIIRNAYYAGNFTTRAAGLLFLQAQDMINFWIALDGGDASGFVNNRCGLTQPVNWNRAYTFADAGAIVHTTVFRDCANLGSRLFSTLSGNAGIVLHETGHQPFGLADEYCCDGGYFRTNLLANVYPNQAACLTDQLSSGVTDACQQISLNICVGGANPGSSCTPNPMGQDPARCGAGISCLQTSSVNWFRLDPLSTIRNDLMVNNLAPQGADQRRINGFFNTCRLSNGDC